MPGPVPTVSPDESTPPIDVERPSIGAPRDGGGPSSSPDDDVAVDDDVDFPEPTADAGRGDAGHSEDAGSTLETDAAVSLDSGAEDREPDGAAASCGGREQRCCEGSIEEECTDGLACHDHDDDEETPAVCTECGGFRQRCCDPNDECDGNLFCDRIPGPNNDLCISD